MIRPLPLTVLLLALACPVSAWASSPGDLNALVDLVAKTKTHDTRVRQERERTFLDARQRQAQLVEELRQRLERERQRGEQLKARFEANESALRELETELQARSGDLGELFGTVKQTAKDLSSIIEESPVSAQFPQRAEWLRTLGASKTLPNIGELQRLWLLLQREIAESGRTIRLPATVVGRTGLPERREIIRVGLFGAISGEDYLRYEPQGHRFLVLSRQPSGSLRQAAGAFARARSGHPTLPLDPTRGTLLSLLVETPNIRERLHQGGIVGYVILALGALGVLVVLIRLAYLGWIQRRIRRQLRELERPRDDNPLGRVLQVAERCRETDPANLELQIDEAVLRELPRLTRGEGLVKLLAGVAPLLGLLGTVVGMIVTFQAISLFGTGDPKLMANGISQALVTTALGLLVAIPLLFMHTLMAARGRRLTQLLDEQSLGLAVMGRE